MPKKSDRAQIKDLAAKAEVVTDQEVKTVIGGDGGTGNVVNPPVELLDKKPKPKPPPPMDKGFKSW